VAIFFLHISSVARSAGRSAPGAAAYRSGERIVDTRSGRVYDYSKRQDVLHKEITLPSNLAHGEASWAQNRATLWNTAEQAEHRRNSRVAREYLLALPHELDAGQRVTLSRALAHDIADRYGVAVDAAIHAPRAGGDQRNFHLHLLTTTREIHADGLGSKSTIELNGTTRYDRGLPRFIDESLGLRQRTATLVNAALVAAHRPERVNHLALDANGDERTTRPRLPWGAYLAEARGLHSEIADRVRAGYAARMQRRALSQNPDHGSSLADIRREARENWLRMRAGAAPKCRTGELERDAPPLAADRDHSL